MAVATTTTIAVIGEGADKVAAKVAAASSNVSFVPIPELPTDPLARHGAALELWRAARRHPPVYTTVAIDPLTALVDAWTRRLDGVPTDLETLIGSTRDEPMPHYFLVDVALPKPRLHWYLDLLAGLSSNRVLPLRLTERELAVALSGLPTGRELPGTLDIAERARDYVPLPELAAHDSAPSKKPV